MKYRYLLAYNSNFMALVDAKNRISKKMYSLYSSTFRTINPQNASLNACPFFKLTTMFFHTSPMCTRSLVVAHFE